MKKNKWLNGLLPMFLVNFAIGAVYCWTLFKEHVNAYTDFPIWVNEWCFSLAIFCLGMSAAFGGKIVEKNPKKSAFLTFIFFTAGWIITGLGIQFKNPWVMVFGFGIVQGIGLGLGYITPVKTMMIWFSDRKGLAGGLSIAGFGIAGVIANPIIGALLDSGMAIYTVFYVMSAMYAVALFAACRLLYRPEVVEEKDTVYLKPLEVILRPKFILLWLIIFLNISCGLAMISQEKQIYNIIGITSMGIVVLYCSFNAISNVIGRIVLAAWQDKLKQKHVPYYVMAVSSLMICFIAALTYSTVKAPVYSGGGVERNNIYIGEVIINGDDVSIIGEVWSDETVTGIPKPYINTYDEHGNVLKFQMSLFQEIALITFISVFLIFVVQFFFGVGFGCLPNILHQNYGLHQLSTVHGFALSAWAIAGLVGNQVSSYILSHFTPQALFSTLGVMYTVMLVLIVLFARVVKKEKQFA